MIKKKFIKREDSHLYWQNNTKIIDKKTLFFLSLILIIVGLSLPFYPLYITLGIFSLFLLTFSLIHEYLILLFLILSFGSVLRIGEGFLPMSFSITEISIYIILFIYIKEFLEINLTRILKEPVVFAFFAFLTMRIIFTILHLPSDPAHMASIVRDSVVAMLSFFVGIIMVKKFGVRRIILAWFIIGILFSILGIIQSNTGKFYFFANVGERQRNYLELFISGTIGMGRSCIGLFGHPNALGLYLQQILMLSLALYLFEKRRLFRIILLLISGILLICIFYTFSRGGYISVLISVIILLLLHTNKTRIIGFILISLTFLFIMKIVIPYFLIYYEQFETLIGRFYIWKVGLKLLKNNPFYIIYGIGAGNFTEKAGTIFSPHNVYLLYLIETGIFTLINLIYFIYLWLKHLIIKYKKTESNFSKGLYLGLLTGSFGYFLHEIIEHSFDSIIFLSIFAFWIGLVSQFEKNESVNIGNSYNK